VSTILVASGVALLAAILFTPYLIRLFTRQGFGQEIRQEGPQTHQSKRGTPTMGGVAILLAMWSGYLVAHLTVTRHGITASALLVLLLTTVLGVVGFLDDLIKVRRQRNLGLNKTSKLVGQLVAAVVFGILAMGFRNGDGISPASTHLSFVRDVAVMSFGFVGFVVFSYLLVSAWSNAVNLADGLDGLAAGAAAMVLATYVIVSFWQYTQDCMGDTGSLAIGGLLAGLSVVTRTELLLVVIGGLFVVEALSVVIQVAVFRTTRRRPFRMAPFHHHFELAGWPETTVIIRFWLLAAICCALGAGVFYSEWLTAAGG
jgi:phospho-N-acetylmuramoyl-pentapeptide-transferase